MDAELCLTEDVFFGSSRLVSEQLIHYPYGVMRDAGDIFWQQDQYGSCALLLGLEVFLCGEVLHLHDDTAAGQ